MCNASQPRTIRISLCKVSEGTRSATARETPSRVLADPTRGKDSMGTTWKETMNPQDCKSGLKKRQILVLPSGCRQHYSAIFLQTGGIYKAIQVTKYIAVFFGWQFYWVYLDTGITAPANWTQRDSTPKKCKKVGAPPLLIGPLGVSRMIRHKNMAAPRRCAPHLLPKVARSASRAWNLGPPRWSSAMFSW